MSSSNSIWCVVPAAGVGKRFGSAMPKQYLSLAGKTVCEHTLERLLQVDAVARIVVCISAEDTTFHRLSIAQDSRISTTLGGAERCNSVLNGLLA